MATILHAKKFSIIALALVSLLLAGCINLQTNLAIYGNEQWTGTQAMQLSAELVELMEQGGTQTTTQTKDGVTMTETTSMETEDIEQWLADAQKYADMSNVDVSFNEATGADGSKSYVLQASGQTYELMNQILFQGEADISVNTVNDQRQVTIVYDSSSDEEGQSQTELTPAEQQMQAEMMKAFGLGIAFRISGGEIISSNASRVEGNTAIWDNSGLIEVTLTEAASLDTNDIALLPPPEGSGFSAAALESLMQDMESSMAEDQLSITADEPTTAQIESSTGVSETVMAESSSTTIAPATEISGEATASDDEAALPASGAVLPGPKATIRLIFAGLVLVVLGGAAGLSWLKR